jgi:hypothetical protein
MTDRLAHLLCSTSVAPHAVLLFMPSSAPAAEPKHPDCRTRSAACLHLCNRGSKAIRRIAWAVKGSLRPSHCDRKTIMPPELHVNVCPIRIPLDASTSQFGCTKDFRCSSFLRLVGSKQRQPEEDNPYKQPDRLDPHNVLPPPPAPPHPPPSPLTWLALALHSYTGYPGLLHTPVTFARATRPLPSPRNRDVGGSCENNWGDV